MAINWTAIGLELAGQTVPLVQQFIQSSIYGDAEERKMKIMKRKINQMQVAIKSNNSPGRVSSPKLTIGIKRNETLESLGRRKWKEFETFLDALPENSSPGEVRTALNKIQANIVNDYPCESCKVNAINNLKKTPLISADVQSKKDAQRKLCEFHNVVNEMLGKPITHDCSVIFA